MFNCNVPSPTTVDSLLALASEPPPPNDDGLTDCALELAEAGPLSGRSRPGSFWRHLSLYLSLPF